MGHSAPKLMRLSKYRGQAKINQGQPRHRLPGWLRANTVLSALGVGRAWLGQGNQAIKLDGAGALSTLGLWGGKAQPGCPGPLAAPWWQEGGKSRGRDLAPTYKYLSKSGKI